MFEVLSTSGDTHLGGDDFDKRIVDYLADDFHKEEGKSQLQPLYHGMFSCPSKKIFGGCHQNSIAISIL